MTPTSSCFIALTKKTHGKFEPDDDVTFTVLQVAVHLLQDEVSNLDSVFNVDDWSFSVGNRCTSITHTLERAWLS